MGSYVPDLTAEDLDKRLEGLSKNGLRELAIEALERSGLRMGDIEEFLSEKFMAADRRVEET